MREKGEEERRKEEEVKGEKMSDFQFVFIFGLTIVYFNNFFILKYKNLNIIF